MDAYDRLEVIYRRTADEIRKREAELEQLRRKFEILEAARLLVLDEMSASESLAIHEAARRAQGNLKEEALKFVINSPNQNGVTAAEVTAHLKTLGFGKETDNRNFYASVYITLRRLAEKDQLSLVLGGQGKLFRRVNATAPIFTKIGPPQ